MRPAATAVLVTAAALFVPAAAFASPRLVAPVPAAAVAELAGSTTTSTTSTTSETTTTTGETTPPPAPNLGPSVPLNIASDRTALNAYATYLQALVKAFPASQASDMQYVADIAGGCKSALEPLTTSSSQVSTAVQTTMTALGEETGEDLAINFDTTALDPFSKFSLALEHLKWSLRGKNPAIVRRYINTQLALSELEPSDLCANALLAASSPQTVPIDTRTFLKQYDKVATVANASFTSFLDLLRTYQTSAEQKLVSKIAVLAAQVTKTSKADLLENGQALTAVLETS